MCILVKVGRGEVGFDKVKMIVLFFIVNMEWWKWLFFFC